MPRSDQIINLVRAGSSGDRHSFTRVLESIVAEERKKQHHVLADRLAEYLHLRSNGNGHGMHARGAGPQDAAASLSSSIPHTIERIPQRQLSQLVLTDSAMRVLRDFIEEQQRSDLLRAHNLEPRHTVLLHGPPGTGKTSLAEAISFELALPLFVVRYDEVVGSYLGETAARLSKLFAAARSRACVLFFDEFDAVGKERGDENETGEIKRVVSSLLMSIDSLPSYVVLVAATNHDRLLDFAAWRRFEVRIEHSLPQVAEMERWLQMQSAGADISFRIPVTALRRVAGRASLADLEVLYLSIARRIVLDGAEARTQSIVSAQVDLWRDQVLRHAPPSKKKASLKRTKL